MRTKRYDKRWLLPVAATAVLAAGCTGDPDMDELGHQLNEDGRAIVDEFENHDPSGGEVTSATPGADGSADEECDGGVLRRWEHGYTVAWPGDPTDDGHINNSFNGALALLSGVLNPLGYSAERSDMGLGAEPRTAVYVRTATDDDVEIEFRVDFELASTQSDDDTITADFRITGTTECLGD